MQDIWKENIDWDTLISERLQNIWLDFIGQLHYLKPINISRWYFTDIPTKIYIIGFCDASTKAYGACIYIRATYPNKINTCNLVMAKSRVAPIKKQQSIPRLELCGALLLAKLYVKFNNSIKNKTKIDKAYLFTDSSIVLCWIKSPYKHKHDSYISHRLMQIIECTQNKDWNYINTKENPADYITRGVMPKDLPSCQLWWNSPSWLLQDTTSWPISVPTATGVDTNNDNTIHSINTITQPSHTDTVVNHTFFYKTFSCYSNFTKIVRITAYIFRFLNKLRKRNDNSSHITVSELTIAHNFVLYIIQLQYFSKERSELSLMNNSSNTSQSTSTTLSHSSLYTFKSSPLRKFNPFIDDNKLIRVGGRIQHSDIPYTQAHPIILPAKDYLTSLIVKQYHEKLLHSGIQTTLYNIRLKYWILNGRNEVKKIIHSCTRCIRFRAQTCGQQMASLPSPRVTFTRAFLHTGVDFSGAIAIRSTMTRNCRYSKGYICLFVCLASRAIHLELVTSLDSQAFIYALKRFISRRGTPVCLYTDNATNFKGSKTELHDLYKMFKSDKSYSEIIDYCTTNCIEYKFTVPLASHMGGIYEAGIKSVKSLLKRHLSSTKLTYELLYTVLVQIEGIVNSRPLCTVTDIPDDVNCLTPAHFIIGSSISDIPEPSILNLNESRLNIYQKVLYIKQRFWKQFYFSYLSELQARNKWHDIKKNLKIGDIVLFKDECTPPTCWPLGKVISTNINKNDNLIRSVVVKTSKGNFTRPIHKLILLNDGQNM